MHHKLHSDTKHYFNHCYYSITPIKIKLSHTCISNKTWWKYSEELFWMTICVRDKGSVSFHTDTHIHSTAETLHHHHDLQMCMCTDCQPTSLMYIPTMPYQPLAPLQLSQTRARYLYHKENNERERFRKPWEREIVQVQERAGNHRGVAAAAADMGCRRDGDKGKPQVR